MVSSAGATTVAPTSTIKLLVLALLENVFVPASVNTTLLNAEEPVAVPLIVCALVPLKVVVAPAVKVPPWVKLPETERRAGATAVAPALTVKSLVLALFENVFVPLPLNSTFASVLVPVIIPERNWADALFNMSDAFPKVMTRLLVPEFATATKIPLP